MKLQDQLTEIEQQAQAIISDVMQKHNYSYCFWPELPYNDETGELNEDFVSKTCLLTLDTEYSANEDQYFASLTGNQFKCDVVVIDEQGIERIYNLLELDNFTLCILADFLTDIKAN